MSASLRSTAFNGRYLLFIAGLGGLLYGIDVGIIAAALLYLSKTISLTVEQTSIIVAAVLGGGMLSSLVAGLLADWLGRRTMMILSGLLFVVSVGLVVISQGFIPLFVGRLLQGMSGGVIAVVVPLYLAECLSAKHRGSGTAIFQFMLTLGIVIASIAGLFYTHQAEAAIAAAASNPEFIRAAQIKAAQDHAWRGMFLSVVYPGFLFFIGAFFLSETPRWLMRKGREDAAMAALLRSCSDAEAQIEIQEMRVLSKEKKRVEEAGALRDRVASLFQRKYVLPFLLACIVLSLNQATGINSMLGYLVIILKQAGMSEGRATQGDVAVKVLNCLMTIVAVALVDKKGRRFLLNIGTAGIVVALVAAGLVFHSFESQRQDLKALVQSHVAANALSMPLSAIVTSPSEAKCPMALTVLYSTGSGSKLVTTLSTDALPVLNIPREANAVAPLQIKRALYGPVPTEATGWIITACLGLFIAAFSVGPGVVVWLMLSELMPTRIRAMGMGIALLLNQGISTGIAAVFLPVVGNYGYYAMFFFWAGCTVFYFLTSAFLLPETKGKSLEEIELYFESGEARARL